MPAKYQPDYEYLRHVPIKRVHIFTFIQVICLVLLWVIKMVKKISIAFPLMVSRDTLLWVFVIDYLSLIVYIITYSGYKIVNFYLLSVEGKYSILFGLLKGSMVLLSFDCK